jgi:hypothetical protein
MYTLCDSEIFLSCFQEMRELRIGVFFSAAYMFALCPHSFLLALDAALYLTGDMFILLPRTKSTKKRFASYNLCRCNYVFRLFDLTKGCRNYFFS